MQVAAPFEPAICVRDLDRAMRFYCNVLGMSVFSIDTVTPEESSAAGLAEHGYRIARLETEHGDRLKLAEPGTPPQSQMPENTVLGRHGYAYLTFIVPDLRAVLDRLCDASVTVRTGPQPVQFRPGVQLIFAEDPEGNFLEFVQREDLDVYRPGRAG